MYKIIDMLIKEWMKTTVRIKEGCQKNKRNVF